MKPKTPLIPTKVDPQLTDPAMIELSGALTANLEWLDAAFHNVEKFTENKGGRSKTYPSVYTGTKKDRGYLKLFPDSHIGNFAYIEVYKQPFDHYPNQSATHSIDFGIVFHFNFEKVYPDDHKNRTLENVKHDVFDVLNRYPFSNFNVRFNEFVEGANNIYRGYSHNEIDSQFLMRPYGGFTIKGKMRIVKKCGGSSYDIITLPTPIESDVNIIKFSIPEAKTGMKDFDGREIYVKGVVRQVGRDSFITHDIDHEIVENYVDSIPRYKHSNEFETQHVINSNFHIDQDDKQVLLLSNADNIEGNVYWFLYYTKTKDNNVELN